MADLYQHYKGGLYRLLHRATEEATMKPVVVYQAVDGNRVWVRSMDEFFGSAVVERPLGAIERVQRFAFIGKEKDDG